jgi:hypothetical protein
MVAFSPVKGVCGMTVLMKIGKVGWIGVAALALLALPAGAQDNPTDSPKPADQPIFVPG